MLYWIILCDVQLSLLPYIGQMYTHMYNILFIDIMYFNTLSTSENNHSNACMPLFNFGVGREKVQEFARIFLKCVFKAFVFEYIFDLSPSCLHNRAQIS